MQSYKPRTWANYVVGDITQQGRCDEKHAVSVWYLCFYISAEPKVFPGVHCALQTSNCRLLRHVLSGLLEPIPNWKCPSECTNVGPSENSFLHVIVWIRYTQQSSIGYRLQFTTCIDKYIQKLSWVWRYQSCLVKECQRYEHSRPPC